MYKMTIVNIPNLGFDEKDRMLKIGREYGEVESHGPDEAEGYEESSYLITESDAVVEAWLDEGKVVRHEDGSVVSAEDLE